MSSSDSFSGARLIFQTAFLTVLVLGCLAQSSQAGYSTPPITVKSRATLQPVEGAVVMITSTMDSASVSTDSKGQATIDIPTGEEGITFTVSHPAYETATVEVWRKSETHCPTVELYLEAEADKYLEATPKFVFKVKYEYKIEEKSLFGRVEINTKIGLRVGDEFGFPVITKSGEVHWPLKVVAASDRNFSSIGFSEDVVAMKREEMRPALKSPLKVDRLGECFMYKTVALSRKFCLHIVD